MEPLKSALIARIGGRGQRLGYRRLILEAAQELGIEGYVRNEPDGSITAFAQGQEALLRKFLEKVKAPPAPIAIERFEETPASPDPSIKHFQIIYGPLAEELQEGFGAMQSEFGDYRQEFRGFVGEFRDYRQEFRDYRKDFDDHRGEFRGFVGEFRDYRKEFGDHREEFKGFRGEFRDYRQEFGGFAERTDQSFKVLDQKYGEISLKLSQLLETSQREALETRIELKRSVDRLSDLVDQFIRSQQRSAKPAGK